MNSPLPQGKYAWASLYDWTYSEVEQCQVGVGSQSCVTAWSNDHGIQEKAMAFFSSTTCGDCGSDWIGETPFF
ncbi:MAG: hypothetical protein ACQSGP_16920 [Frankia sp.]